MPLVCVIATGHAVDDVRVFQKQAKTLYGAGYRVKLLAPNSGDAVLDGIEVVGLPQANCRLSRVLVVLSAFWLAWRMRADIYHFHDLEFLMCGLLLKIITWRIVIYDVHEYYPQAMLTREWIPCYLRKAVSMGVNLVEKNTSRFFSAVVTTDEYMRDIFVKYNHHCISVCNYPLIERFAGTPPDKKTGKKIILYLGRVSRETCLANVLETIPLVRDAYNNMECCLVGPRDEEEMAPDEVVKLQDLVDNNILRVQGSIPYVSVPGCLQECDIAWIAWLATPSSLLGTANKLYEYMAAARPIVAPDFPNLRKVIGDARCGLLVENSPTAHAGALLYLLEHPEEASLMGANGRSYCAENYSWDSQGKKLLVLYRNLLSCFQ